MSDRPTPTTIAGQLARGRADLLGDIDQPPLAQIRLRAARRRRRRTVRRHAGLLAVAAATTLLLHPWTARTAPPAHPVAEAPPAAPVYTDAGITIQGLSELSRVPRLTGTTTDVEFTDPEHGYLLAQCALDRPCPASVSRTTNGGTTWQGVDLPDSARGVDLDLLAFPDGRLVVTGGDAGWTSTDDGRTWQKNIDPNPDWATGHELLRAGPGTGRRGPDVQLWRSGQGRPTPTTSQPDLRVCWVAPVATVDGAWWVGGLRNGKAGLSVTRDLGASWQPVALPGALAGVRSVEVAALGSHLYAVALGDNRALVALFHSANGGQSFTQTRGPVGGVPAGLAGAMVPLLDGRLLVTGTDRRWYVSANDGATFTRADGNLPTVGRLARTHAGYLAYDLFSSGWTAFSVDGATWHKLAVN